MRRETMGIFVLMGSTKGRFWVCDARAQFKWNVMNNITTYVKQKKSVVEPTRKKVAADTGTYRDGRRGLLCGTTAWGSGDEDGTRPPLWLLPPGITSCVVSATATPCHSELFPMPTTGLWGRQSCEKQNVRHVKERSLSITWENRGKNKGLLWTVPRSWHACMYEERFKD